MKNTNLIYFVALVGLTLLFTSSANAQPTLQEVLGDTQIVDHQECAVVTVGFNFRVRYKKHFPSKSGEELRIHIEPMALSQSEKESLIRQEAIVPPESEIAAIDEIVYEGFIDGNPILTLFFKHPVSYTVEQGTDFRSIVISVFLPSATTPCIP